MEKKDSNKAKSKEQKKVEKAKQEEAQKAARREAAARYQALKEKVLEREKDNYSEIILLQDKEKPGDTKKRWWKIFGHSVHILKYRIAVTHDLSFVIQEDSDFGVRSKEGAILIPNLDTFVNLMTRKGYTVSKKAKECVVIDIGETLSVEQYQALLEVDKRLEQRLHSLIRPEHMVQALNSVVKELDKKTDETVRKLNAPAREAYGSEMVKITIWMTAKLMMVARGSYDYGRYLEELFGKTEEMWGYITVMMNRRSLELEKIMEVGEALRAVEKIAEQERIALKRKEQNESTNE